MSRNFSFLVFFLLIAVAVSCSDPDRPEDLLDEDRYVHIFTELVIIQQLTDDQLGPVSREHLVEQVYEKYDVSEDRFNRSHHYFQRQPDKQLERIDRVESRIKAKRDLFQERLDEETEGERIQPAVRDTT